MRFVFLTDPIYTALASARPAVAWGVELVKMGYRVAVAAPAIGEKAYRYLTSLGLQVKARIVDSDYSVVQQLLSLIEGGRDVEVGEEGVLVNFSNTVRIPSTAYYFQGFLTDMARDVGGLAKVLTPLFKLGDESWLKAMKTSRVVIANSSLSARQLEEKGLKPNAVIYPPLQSSLVKSLLEVDEEGSYYLVYSGKETDWRIVKWFMRNLPGDWRAFGKFNPPKGLGIEKIPIVPEEDLPKAVYAGARLVLFTYRHEPFGYVTVEAALAGKPSIAIGPSGQGPWEQWRMGYPVLWLPEPALKLKIPRPPTWEERLRVASMHDASSTVKLLLTHIPTPHPA